MRSNVFNFFYQGFVPYIIFFIQEKNNFMLPQKDVMSRKKFNFKNDIPSLDPPITRKIPQKRGIAS